MFRPRTTGIHCEHPILVFSYLFFFFHFFPFFFQIYLSRTRFHFLEEILTQMVTFLCKFYVVLWISVHLNAGYYDVSGLQS